MSKEAAGRRLAKARRKDGLTQRQVADELGVDPSFIARLEACKARPGGDLMHRIWGRFGIPMQDWFEASGKAA